VSAGLDYPRPAGPNIAAAKIFGPALLRPNATDEQALTAFRNWTASMGISRNWICSPVAYGG